MKIRQEAADLDNRLALLSRLSCPEIESPNLRSRRLVTVFLAKANLLALAIFKQRILISHRQFSNKGFRFAVGWKFCLAEIAWSECQANERLKHRKSWFHEKHLTYSPLNEYVDTCSTIVILAQWQKLSINKWTQPWKLVGVFQNQGVCGQAFPSFPSPTPFLPLFCSSPSRDPNFVRKQRERLLRRLLDLVSKTGVWRSKPVGIIRAKGSSFYFASDYVYIFKTRTVKHLRHLKCLLSSLMNLYMLFNVIQ